MEFSICWLTPPPLPTYGKFFRDFLLSKKDFWLIQRLFHFFPLKDQKYLENSKKRSKIYRCNSDVAAMVAIDIRISICFQLLQSFQSWRFSMTLMTSRGPKCDGQIFLLNFSKFFLNSLNLFNLHSHYTLYTIFKKVCGGVVCLIIVVVIITIVTLISERISYHWENKVTFIITYYHYYNQTDHPTTNFFKASCFF